MNDSHAFERFVADQFGHARDTAHPTETLLDEIVAGAAQTRQRPRWLAIIKEPPMRISSTLAVGSPTARVAAIVLATLLIALSVAGAGLAGARILAAESGPERPVTIGFANILDDGFFYGGISQGVEQAAEAAAVELDTRVAYYDPDEQARQIMDMVEGGVDAIVVVPGEPDTIVPAVEAANEAGIPVVTVDQTTSGGEIAAYVASDNVAGGRMAGEYLVETMGGRGEIVELLGGDGSAAMDRAEGFALALETAPGVTVVAQDDAWGDFGMGRTVARTLLQVQPDATGLFAINDPSALGAIGAIEAMGLTGQVQVVGFDGDPEAVAAIAAGTMAGTIAQQPQLMGSTALEAALAAVFGEPVEAYIPVEVMLVTAENADAYLQDLPQ